MNSVAQNHALGAVEGIGARDDDPVARGQAVEYFDFGETGGAEQHLAAFGDIAVHDVGKSTAVLVDEGAAIGLRPAIRKAREMGLRLARDRFEINSGDRIARVREARSFRIDLGVHRFESFDHRRDVGETLDIGEGQSRIEAFELADVARGKAVAEGEPIGADTFTRVRPSTSTVCSLLSTGANRS